MAAMTKICYEAVEEETLFIDLPKSGGLRIKTILRGTLNGPLILMVHGLPGDGNELLQFLGARYLYEQGFSTLRLFLYAFDDHTRNLVDCTLQTHADDFDAVVGYARKHGATQIFAEGHSYGGATILKAQGKLDAAVLWDPSHGLIFRDKAAREADAQALTRQVDDLKLYLDGYGYIEPKAITQEQLNMGDTTDWAAHKGYPLKVISAGKGIMTQFGKRYIDAADKPSSHSVIPDAHHQFEDSDAVMFDLFEQTANWFKEVADGRN